MMHHHAKFGYKRLGDSEDIVQTKPAQIDGYTSDSLRHHHHQFLNREGRWGTTDDFPSVASIQVLIESVNTFYHLP